MPITLSRRSMLLGAALVPLGVRARAFDNALPLRLRTVPTRIYRSAFNPRENMDGWVFFLMLEASEDRPFIPVSLRIAYHAAGEVVREEVIRGPLLAAMSRQDILPARLTGDAPDPPTYWPQALRIHCYLPHAPMIQELGLQLRVADRSGIEHHVEGRIPIIDFQQRAALIFPFRGPGIISQGGVLGGGHRNRSGGFAIDALGLARNHGPMRAVGSDLPQDYAGWGRPIIAPGMGVVVRARNDRPDQPRDGVSDPAYFAPEYPSGGDVGNHVVIDHGEGEFSLIAHLRLGSVRVRTGDRVAQAQPIAELGNSGDTSGPHLHYQLQDGPRWEYADGLPVRFSNVSNLTRGSYFNAR